MVHPPREASDDDEDSMDGQVVNFDKLTVQRRAQMRQQWGQNTVEGDPV